MKRALITGLKGFTGGYVAAELAANGWDVWGLGTQESTDDPQYFQVDLTELDSLTRVVAEVRPDVVVHLAAVAFVGHGDAEEFYRVNLIGTRNLLSSLCAIGNRPDCVLLASSANIYGNAVGGRLSESTPPSPANDYAVSKVAMEYMVRLWLDKLPVVLTRPFNYTGVGQSINFLLPKIIDHCHRRADVIELGNLDVSRDFCDVRAVAHAYRRILEVQPTGQTVNVCSERTYSLREVLAMVESISGHHMRVHVNQAFVRNNEVKELCGDASLLRNLIGAWDPPHLNETLRWMIEEKPLCVG